MLSSIKKYLYVYIYIYTLTTGNKGTSSNVQWSTKPPQDNRRSNLRMATWLQKRQEEETRGRQVRTGIWIDQWVSFPAQWSSCIDGGTDHRIGSGYEWRST